MTKSIVINNLKFARDGGHLEREIDLALLSRVQEFEAAQGLVKIELTGFVNKKELAVLNLKIYGKIIALCQNCLESMDIDLSLDTDIVIADTVEEADQLMFSDDTGVEYAIVKEDECDITSLVEDEIITNFPIAPKHESCQVVEVIDRAENAFAVLKNKF